MVGQESWDLCCSASLCVPFYLANLFFWLTYTVIGKKGKRTRLSNDLRDDTQKNKSIRCLRNIAKNTRVESRVSQYGPQRQRLHERAEAAAASAAREAGVAFDPEAVTVTKAAKRKARGKAYAERRDMLAHFERAQEIKKILEDLIKFRLCAPAVPCVGVALFPCPPKKGAPDRIPLKGDLYTPRKPNAKLFMNRCRGWCSTSRAFELKVCCGFASFHPKMIATAWWFLDFWIPARAEFCVSDRSARFQRD